MKILFNMASGQTAPNISPLREIKPDKVVIAITEGMQDKGGTLIAETNNTISDIERLDISNESSLKALTEQFSAWLEAHIDDEIIVNITGGTKLMSLAAYQVFNSWGFRCFYCNKDNSELIWLDDETKISNIGSRIGLKRYLRSYEFIIEGKQKLAQVPKAHKEYARLIYEALCRPSRYKQTASLISKINAHTAQTVLKKDELKRLSFNGEEKLFLKQLSEETGLFNLMQDGSIEVVDSSDKAVMNGGWLEIITADSLRDKDQLFRDISIGVEIAKSTQRAFTSTRQEIDVMAMRQDKLMIIECKTKKWKTAAEASSAIYKLSALRNIGGINTQPIFVSLFDLPASAKTRAAEHGIRLLSGKNDMQSLEHLLKIEN